MKYFGVSKHEDIIRLLLNFVLTFSMKFWFEIINTNSNSNRLILHSLFTQKLPSWYCWPPTLTWRHWL